MANKQLFKTPIVPPQVKHNPKNLTVVQNEAGGTAFAFADKHALAQYAVTGTFSNTFYATAEGQLEKVKQLVGKVDSLFIAKLAVYARESGKMKDVSAYLLAVLHGRGETELLTKVFDRVVDNFKMLANFVQIVRSGVTGRKSFGSVTKRLIQNWLVSRRADKVFAGSIGLSNPSVADIIKMVHPQAKDEVLDATFAYIIESRGWQEKSSKLPEVIRTFEALKKGETRDIPNVPFRALTNVKLDEVQWKAIARNMPWNTLRMNLNMLDNKGLFKDSNFMSEIAAKLTDRKAIVDSKAFPYTLFTAFQNTTDLPQPLRLALQDAAEIATENVPVFSTGKVVVAVDVSGSMGSAVTGNRGTVSTKTRCVDLAGLIASCVLRQNKYAEVILFNMGGYGRRGTGAWYANLNPRDSIMTNAQNIANQLGGGTDISLPLKVLNQENKSPDLIIYVSDNESWAGLRYGTVSEWDVLKKRNPKAKLVNIDIQAVASSQVPDNKDVLNIGGFSDAIWPAIAEFANENRSNDFVGYIESGVSL